MACKKQLIYIAGPYSKGDVAVNVNNAIKAADKLVEAGFLAFIPHLTHFWHIVSPKAWEFWIQLDLACLAFCDGVLRLPGESEGADREVRRAKELGIPVYYSLDELEGDTVSGGNFYGFDWKDMYCPNCGLSRNLPALPGCPQGSHR